jgi:hypothetical protein
MIEEKSEKEKARVIRHKRKTNVRWKKGCSKSSH